MIKNKKINLKRLYPRDYLEFHGKKLHDISLGSDHWWFSMFDEPHRADLEATRLDDSYQLVDRYFFSWDSDQVIIVPWRVKS